MNYKRIKGKPKNKYIELEDCIKGITTKGEEFFIDKEDFDKIKDWTWHIDNYGYVASSIKKQKVQQHRFLMGLQKGDDMQIDHINRVKIDNRKKNLRISTRIENQRNKGAMSTSKTGIRGVCYEKERNKWRVQISTDTGRKRYRCDTLKEAIELRKS